MAKRYKGNRARKFGSRGISLFLIPMPLLWGTVSALGAGSAMGAITGLGCAALYYGAAFLMREGLTVEAEYHKRKLALAPKLPAKSIAIVLMGVATFATVWFAAGQGIAVGAVAGLVAAGASFMAYGADPRTDKGGDAAFGLSLAELQITIHEAEAKIAQIEAARGAISNQQYKDRLTRIADKARGVLEAIEEEPTDVRRSFRFLHVYLDGAQRVATEFGKMTGRGQAQELEGNFARVLDNIERVFEDQRQKLIAREVFDLDVQIEALNTQLENEGVG